MNAFKALLVIGMIFGHGIDMLTTDRGFVLRGLSMVIRLITFSGFFFCFGYVFNLAYGNKKIALGKKFRSIIFPLVAYYISAIAWVVIAQEDFRLMTFVKVVTTAYTPPYSEFLLAFALMSLVYWLLKTSIDKYKNTSSFIVFTALLLLPSLVTFDRFYPSVDINGRSVVIDEIVGLFLGSSQTNYFPIVQYSFFFFVGIIFSERKIVFSPKVLFGCIVGTAAFLTYFLISGEPPSRFPPHLLWLTGSWLLLYLCYLASKKVTWLQNTTFMAIGENTLVYLLLSNIIFFELSETSVKSSLFAFSSSLAIIAMITFILACTRKPRLIVSTNESVDRTGGLWIAATTPMSKHRYHDFTWFKTKRLK